MTARNGNRKLTPKLLETGKGVGAKIQALKAQGCRVVLVRLPAGQRFTSANNPNMAFADQLARELSLVQIDLDAECSSRGKVLTYSDGLHLAPAAARETSRLLSELLPEMESAAVQVRQTQ